MKKKFILMFYLLLMGAAGYQLYLWGVSNRYTVKDNYLIVYESNGKLYEIGKIGRKAATEKNSGNNSLYLDTVGPEIEKIIAVSQDDYQVKDTNNKYFSGEVMIKPGKYIIIKEIQKNAAEIERDYLLLDNDGNILHTFSDLSKDKFLFKLPQVHSSSNSEEKGYTMYQDGFINITEVIKLYGKNMKVHYDEKNLLFIISF
ncbi:hypothetical protein [Sebaldella sp. S0638]|uniref:hypothetical protein n=1 Tax=Sebaldella sp. S0638 TaxID=2957809 RepID=UPI00209CC745|nr:hypothetical protein [Sebaldella sp. S0638]MCP1224272.1 hypothetical protein [Sebaldella sp. S0638]